MVKINIVNSSDMDITCIHPYKYLGMCYKCGKFRDMLNRYKDIDVVLEKIDCKPIKEVVR